MLSILCRYDFSAVLDCDVKSLTVTFTAEDADGMSFKVVFLPVQSLVQKLLLLVL
jgi:hypothetical protein